MEDAHHHEERPSPAQLAHRLQLYAVNPQILEEELPADIMESLESYSAGQRRMFFEECARLRAENRSRLRVEMEAFQPQNDIHQRVINGLKHTLGI